MQNRLSDSVANRKSLKWFEASLLVRTCSALFLPFPSVTVTRAGKTRRNKSPLCVCVCVDRGQEKVELGHSLHHLSNVRPTVEAKGSRKGEQQKELPSVEGRGKSAGRKGRGDPTEIPLK